MAVNGCYRKCLQFSMHVTPNFNLPPLFFFLQERRRSERAEQQRVRAEKERDRQTRLAVREQLKCSNDSLDPLEAVFSIILRTSCHRLTWHPQNFYSLHLIQHLLSRIRQNDAIEGLWLGKERTFPRGKTDYASVWSQYLTSIFPARRNARERRTRRPRRGQMMRQKRKKFCPTWGPILAASLQRWDKHEDMTWP